MDSKFKINRMTADQVQIAIDWAAREGWNPGIHDAELFYHADPNGFFIGTFENQPVAVGNAVVYDDEFAFCGLYIVEPGYRRRGFGLALTRARLEYVGARNAGIDGVLENISIYERVGYRLAYQNFRYRGSAKKWPVENSAVRPLAEFSFTQLEAYDRECFPAPRSIFLRAWISQPDALALGFLDGGQLKGFTVRRQCIDGHKIGPLFADNLEIALALLRAVQSSVAGAPIVIDIPEINAEALALVQSQPMEQVFATGRMYLKGHPNLADHKIFGISTYELG